MRVTVVGNIPIVNIGETLQIEGEWIYHPKYGEQVEIERVSTVILYIEWYRKYLSSGLILIKVLNCKKNSRKVWERLFRCDSVQSRKIKRDRRNRRQKISKIVEAFEEQRDLRDIMIFLQQYGIGTLMD